MCDACYILRVYVHSVQFPTYVYVFICIADTGNKFGCGAARESLNHNAFDKRCKRTCNEITKCVLKEHDPRRDGKGRYREFGIGGGGGDGGVGQIFADRSISLVRHEIIKRTIVLL